MFQKHVNFISRTLLLDGRYLNIPIKAGAPRRTLTLEIEGQVVRAFDVELAGDQVDFWAFVEVAPWRGQSAGLKLHQLPTIRDPAIRQRSTEAPLQTDALDALTVGEEIHDSAELFQEALRPQFHFTTRRGWHNDPNGMMYHAGEYHLFYQYQPFSVSSFSDKSWGHAVSRDLLHWEELPIALHADHEGAKWSGSGVVDRSNVSGLQKGAAPPLLLFYTATGTSAQNPRKPEPGDYVQSIAVSHDRGRTWLPCADNPVLPNITPGNRDPWVFWHEPTQKWVMTLYVGVPESWTNNQHAARIFTSEDLKTWHHESTVEGFFDCPILFSLPLDGNEAEPRWIIHCANMKYRVGRFDGREFIAESDLLVGQRGECAYAPQLFNHAPLGRRIQIAWGRTQAPGMPFSQIMTFPCELSLVTTEGGPRMRWQPVAEITRLYQASTHAANLVLDPQARSPRVLGRGRHLDMQILADVGQADEIEINVRGIPVICSVQAKTLTVNEHVAPLALTDGKLQLRLLLDRISLELFAGNGTTYMPLAILPATDNETVTAGARGGAATLLSLTCHELSSIWSGAALGD